MVNFLDKEGRREAFLIAKKTLENYFSGDDYQPEIKNKKLLIKGPGVFVTLKKSGSLRGCIGVFQSDEFLYQTIKKMSLEAAFGDPRFYPLKKEELPEIEVEISILTPPKKINDWKKIRLGVDGVIVESGFRRGVFLPQVAKETGWNLEKFLRVLCQEKAGLPADCYKQREVNLYIFQVQEVK